MRWACSNGFALAPKNPADFSLYSGDNRATSKAKCTENLHINGHHVVHNCIREPAMKQPGKNYVLTTRACGYTTVVGHIPCEPPRLLHRGDVDGMIRACNSEVAEL